MRRKLSYDEIFSKRPSLTEIKKLERIPVYALIENIRSMHNVGSIFRTSDGIRLGRLYLSGYTAKPPRREIDKTALGATDSVPWHYERDSQSIIDQMKKEGVEIVVVEHSSDSVNYTELDCSFPVCVVFGNEVEGVSQKIVSRADKAIEIPMAGIKQSLNVSVAYGIVMYHIFQQLNLSSV